MKLFYLLIGLLATTSNAMAEIVDSDNGALAVWGKACEEIKAGESNAATRVKAVDKASYGAVVSLPEIVNIKDSFDDHDFNVMVYNIVDEYLEDLSIKTSKQDNEQICVEVSGYVSPENIGKAIDDTIQTNDTDDSAQIIKEAVITEKHKGEIITESGTIDISDNTAMETTEIKPTEPEAEIVVLSTIYIKPTEFYNGTQSLSHSEILKRILSLSDKIKIVASADEANFIITPRVEKAKIEPLNSTTSRMQMVVSLDIFDRNKNQTVTETQNKYVLFNSSDNEQSVAKQMLSQLLELNSDGVLRLTERSSEEAFAAQQTLPTNL